MANRADFAPELGALKSLRPFVFWAQTTLPTVFDDSLSYYEVLTKLCKMVNTMLENEDTNAENIAALAEAYQELEDFTNNYFENLDVTQEINDKLDELVADGTIGGYVVERATTLFNDYLYGEDGESGKNKEINDMISEAQTDIEEALANFATRSNLAVTTFETNSAASIRTFEDRVDDELAGVSTIVEDWMDANFTNPSSVVIDDTLTVKDAAAEAYATGKLMDDATNMVLATSYWQDYVVDSVSGSFILADVSGGSNPAVGTGAPSKTLYIANVTPGETYIVSGVASSYSTTRYTPAYALGNLTYDASDNPYYEFYDVYPRGWDESQDPGTVYQYVRNQVVRIPTGTTPSVTHLFIVGDSRVPITVRCSRLNVRTDTALTSESLPAQGKATGDALDTKIPWPVTDGSKDVGTAGKRLASNGDGTTRWADTGDYDEEIEDLQNSIAGLKNSLGKANVINLFEVGDIAMSTTGWTYANNNTRVRTRNGITLPMKAGTKIGLTDYADASYYVGWKYGDNQYGMRGWLSTEYETPVDGEYVILIRSNSSTAQIDETELASLFYGYDGIAFNYINENSGKLDEFESVSFDTKNGYISADGRITNPTQGAEVYTSKIPIESGYKFDICLQYTEVHSMWLAYVLYDSNGHFISRTVLKESNVPQMKSFLTISEASAKYVAFTYRSYGESTIVIKTDKNLKILEKEIFESALPSLKNKLISLSAEKAVRGIAHRGYASIAPENTASAFIEASKAGFTAIETDIRFTSDNVPVLIHDATVNRTSNGSGNVADMTLQQLKALDFGSWFGTMFTGEKILTLSEGIELCKKLGLKMLLENKTWGGATDAELRGTIANAIKRYAYKDSVMIMYDAAGALANFASELPNVPMVLIQNDIDGEITARINTLKNVTDSVYVSVNYINITAEKIETILNLDAKVLLWTIDDENAIENVDIGVSGIISNSLNAPVVLYNGSIGAK